MVYFAGIGSSSKNVTFEGTSKMQKCIYILQESNSTTLKCFFSTPPRPDDWNCSGRQDTICRLHAAAQIETLFCGKLQLYLHRNTLWCSNTRFVRSRSCDEPFAFRTHRRTVDLWLHYTSSIFLSYELREKFLQVDKKIVITWTEDIWFPWCHSLPDMTGWGVEVQRLWLFNESLLKTLNGVLKVHAKFSMKII